ncbi:MAG: methylenetetrahydrofolate--tRNA-(uracil(54)-C(5))-methyltransferase (FADH(2)-oxidizing) TrmFO [Christensenellales bacterium]|nr:methylenetetrahydrofolate--tRNA-(uracil(54)-C(5))-methyltransferase (FADH(2)-oxidizing) TrmFO [Clostridium sp.]MDD5982046.1 methylenetetrahydrofolate--tRNA-(uracil(54)-C(5))-methyltransferase (FADH(2)-oxidizing) TrmFO [Clostridium sp.]
MQVNVIGAGLAGCECAAVLAERGIGVRLFEMKPSRRSPAHRSDGFAELVCSNSLRSDKLDNAVGLLKQELRCLGSLIMRCADATSVPAGGALAVDRELFSKAVTEAILSNPNIEVVTEEVTSIPEGPTVIATGPLTDGKLLTAIEELLGDSLHFFDAAAPIVTAESLNMERIFAASRYDRGSDYLNCPMTRLEYFLFIRALTEAETAPLHEFETVNVFEGCMPVEIMAKRGDLTLAYGPLKPVGFENCTASDGKKPFAVVQLRKENLEGTLYNIVGFQTNLKFGEQRRVFGMIPGLENAEYMRYGVMHRNSFLKSPKHLTPYYSLRSRPELFFAGQLTGVEGYVESASSGFIAGINMARYLKDEAPIDFTRKTAMGALAHYVSEYNGGSFQPMNANFGIMESLQDAPREKLKRFLALSDRSLGIIGELAGSCK